MRRILVLDSSYCFEAIIQRGLYSSITCRDLDGFFDHVYSVHPFASLVSSPAIVRFGFAEWHKLSSAHTFIDGKVGLFSWLHLMPPFNFVLSQLALTIQLVFLVHKKRISVIRAGDPLYLGILGWTISKFCRVPLVVRVGSNNDKIYEITNRPLMPKLFISRRIEKLVERFVLSKANLVAAANNDNLMFAIRSGTPPERSTLFRYGNLIYSGHFLNPSERKHNSINLIKELLLEPCNFILYIGRLEPIKHPDHVLRVLADLLSNKHNVKALLVGDGSLIGSLKALSIELCIEDKVIFCGNRSQEWLSMVIPHAAVCLSPHTGRALTEAALGSVPIVAYDIDWQSELIESGVTGMLIPFLDLKSFTSATDSLLRDRSLAERLGHGARSRAMEMMNPDLLDDHEKFHYSKLLDNS